MITPNSNISVNTKPSNLRSSSRGIRRVAGLVLVVVIAHSVAEPISLVKDGKQVSSKVGALEIEVVTNKAAYDVEEPILVTVTIRNNGEEEVFLARNFMLYLGSLLEIEVKDSKGNPIRPKRNTAPDLVGPGDDLARFILQTHEVFYPQEFRGFTASLGREGFDIKKPGPYRVRAKYKQLSYSDRVSEKQFKKAQAALRFPWWADIQSEWVEFRIQP